MVDFSEQRVQKHTLSNDTLETFMDMRREDWVEVRWVVGFLCFMTIITPANISCSASMV